MKRPAAKSPEFPPPQPPSQRCKKTRELPNLSDCHCCNRHVNTTNPKNRLKLLTSQWRIVLLCKSCYNLVENSQFCSYCLSRVSDSFYDCKRCHHRVHRDCVPKFSFGLDDGDCGGDNFSVCFDCWLPNVLENEYRLDRALRRGSSKKKGGKNGVESVTLASSGMCDLKEKGKGLEDVLLDANAVVEKKAVVAAEAKEKAFEKIMAAKKAIEAARGVLGIVAVDKDGDQGGVEVDEDVQFAIRLHRAMNSSPRISRNMCLLNTHCVDTPKEIVLGNRLASEGEQVMNGCRQECENKVGRVQDKKYNGGSNGCWITYIRKGQTVSGVKQEGPHCSLRPSKGVEQEASLRLSTRVDFKEEPDGSLRVSTSEVCKEEPDHSLTVSTGEKCNEKPDCSLRVYCRKPPQVVKREVVAGLASNCSKTYSRRRVHCKSKLVNNRLNHENGNCEGFRTPTTE